MKFTIIHQKRLVGLGNLLTGILFLVGLIIPIGRALAQKSEVSVTKKLVILAEADTSINYQNGLPENKALLYLKTRKIGGSMQKEDVIYLHFNLAHIPQHAVIESISLQLYPTSKSNGVPNVFKISSNSVIPNINWQNQPVKEGEPLHNKGKLVAKTTNLPDYIDFIFNKDSIQTWQQQAAVKFIVLHQNAAAQTSYYSNRGNNKNLQPKLLVSYKIVNEIANSDWPQYKNGKTYQEQYLWRSNTHATAYSASELFMLSPGNLSYNKLYPLIINKQLIFPVQSNQEEQYQLYSIPIDHPDIKNKMPVNAIIKWQPLADQQQRMYLFTGQTSDSLKVISTAGTLKEVFKTKIRGAFQINANPTIGTDGSLYLTTDSGLYAYTAIPSFRIKWQYATKDAPNFFGSMALNASEDTLYVCRKNIAGKLCLLALSNIDGKLLWENCIAQDADAEQPQFIPVPLVTNDKIYLTSGYDNGTHFYAFNKANGESILLDHAEQAYISKATMADQTVYVINNKTLNFFKGTSLSHSISNDNLQPTSKILLDGNEHIYQLNTEKASQSFVVQYQDGNKATLALPYNQYGNLSHNLLIPLPYGTWLTGNISTFYHIKPTAFAQKEAISIPFHEQFETSYLYQSEGDITVKGKSIKTGGNILVHSFNNIHFLPGFSVQTGAQLQCKTGK